MRNLQKTPKNTPNVPKMKSKIGRIGKPQKSRKQKSKPINYLPMQQTGKGKDKNVEPTKDDDNWIPRGVKEMMWAKTKLENGKKRKGAFIKDSDRGVTKPLEKAPKFIRGRNESEHEFLDRINQETKIQIMQLKAKAGIKTPKSTTDTKDTGTNERVTNEKVTQEKLLGDSMATKGSRKKERNREKKKRKVEALKLKKLERQGDFAALKDNFIFGEVVDQPPSLTAKPRKAQPRVEQNKPGMKSLLLKQIFESGEKDENKTKPATNTGQKSLATRAVGKTVKRKHLSFAQQRITDAEREKAINMYRQLKKAKSNDKQKLEKFE